MRVERRAGVAGELNSATADAVGMLGLVNWRGASCDLLADAMDDTSVALARFF